MSIHNTDRVFNSLLISGSDEFVPTPFQLQALAPLMINGSVSIKRGIQLGDITQGAPGAISYHDATQAMRFWYSNTEYYEIILPAGFQLAKLLFEVSVSTIDGTLYLSPPAAQYSGTFILKDYLNYDITISDPYPSTIYTFTLDYQQIPVITLSLYSYKMMFHNTSLTNNITIIILWTGTVYSSANPSNMWTGVQINQIYPADLIEANGSPPPTSAIQFTLPANDQSVWFKFNVKDTTKLYIEQIVGYIESDGI